MRNKPHLGHARIFTSVAFVHDPTAPMAAHGIKGVLVGFATGNN